MSLAEKTATVSFIKNGYAYLKSEKVSACSSCSSRSVCGVNGGANSGAYDLRIKNNYDLKKGETVVLEIKSSRLLLATFTIYILPLLLLFIFAYFAKILFGELASIFGGISGLLIGLLLIRYIFSRYQLARHFEPQVVRRASVDL